MQATSSQDNNDLASRGERGHSGVQSRSQSRALHAGRSGDEQRSDGTMTLHCLLGFAVASTYMMLPVLYNVGHIPNSGVRLVSLGFLLNHGAKIHGDMEHLRVTYGNGTPLACFIWLRISLPLPRIMYIHVQARSPMI